jgi:hypothetical protein
VKRRFILFAWAAVLTLATLSTANAQCRDAWISRAVQEITGRPVRGSGDRDECNKMDYGRGSWSSFEDLKSKVQVAGICKDTWITQAYKDPQGAGHVPEGWGTIGQCNVKLYNNGTWGSYNHLRNLVRELKTSLVTEGILPEVFVIPGRNPATNSNALAVAFVMKGKIQPQAKLIGLDGSTLIGNDVAGLVGNDGASQEVKGGTIVQKASDGQLIAAGGGNATWPRQVTSSTTVKNLSGGLKLKF